MTHPPRTLSVWLSQKDPIAVTEVWSLLAAGLQFLARYHHHGLVYGNLSPTILQYTNSRWQVLAAQSPQPEPEYIAPEHLQGQPCLSSDLYSLGLMAWQLLTGKTPFSFLPIIPAQLIIEPLMNLDPPDDVPLSDADPAQAINHRSLRLFLQKLLHPDAAQRFPDALTAHRHLPKSEQYNYPLGDLETLPESRHQATQWQTVSELLGHEGYSPQINAVSFLGDAHLISASDDRTLKIWYWPSGICEHTLRVHTSFVKALAVAPNQQAFASGGADGKLIIHPIAPPIAEDADLALTYGIAHRITLPPLVSIAHSQAINAIVFSPDSQIIITASADKSIGIWSVTGQQLYHLPNAHDLGILSLAMSADGHYIATGSSDRTIKVWRLVATNNNQANITKQVDITTNDVNNGYKLTLVQQIRHHTWGVSALAFSPRGASAASQWLASGGQDNMIYIWSMAQIQEQRPITQTLQTTIKGHSWTVAALCFVNPQQLWSASWDKTIKCWAIPQGQNLHTLKGHTNSISTLAWQTEPPTGGNGQSAPSFRPSLRQCISSGSYDATLRVWQDIANPKQP